LLAFARRQPLKPDEIGRERAGRRHQASCWRAPSARSVQIKLELESTIPQIVADPAQLETTIANLANNAPDAMPRAAG